MSYLLCEIESSVFCQVGQGGALMKLDYLFVFSVWISPKIFVLRFALCAPYEPTKFCLIDHLEISMPPVLWEKLNGNEGYWAWAKEFL